MNINLYKLFFKIDTSFKKAGRFIDLESFIKDEDDELFIKMTVKPRLPFYKVPEILKRFAVALYLIESQELKERFPWVYNPPTFAGNNEVTTGSIERENFAKDYGGYVEMIYLCSNQDPTKWEEIYEWDTEKFLFVSEYLLRKRTVENLK